MAIETTFFSYSRADSAFVLKLAKELREAGAELWLDQLDIKPGSHWDASIETALNAASTMIVILSVTSVASNNVMDEVSYALEKGKKVIPVLLNECTPPFRLRRLQHIDFTGDYEKGFNLLLQALNISEAQNKKIDVEKPALEAVKKTEDDISQAEQKQQEELENKLWEEALRLNTDLSYKKYLTETVTGIYKKKAYQLIEQLELVKKNKELETQFWEKVKTENTISSYDRYLKKYPQGIYKADALIAIKEIKQTQKQKPEIPVKKDIILVEEQRHRKSKKKYLLIAVVVLLLGFVIWSIVQYKHSSDDASLKEFGGHESSVVSVAFSPDGKTILTCDFDRTARLWDLDGKTLKEFKGFSSVGAFMKGGTFSPDGNAILITSGDIARLYDLEGVMIQELGGNHISAASFSPDGKTILTSNWHDSTMSLWDLKGNRLQEFKGFSGNVYRNAFSPDGKKILTGFYDGTVRLWDLEGNTLQVFRGSSATDADAAFSPDGKTILTGNWDDLTASLWDLKGNRLREFKGHSKGVSSIAFSPDGKTILTGSQDETARLWDLEGNTLQEFKGKGLIGSVAFSPDGKTILTGSSDGTVRLWKIAIP